MPFTNEQITEMEVLLHYNIDNTLEGIKVHKTARPEVIEATRRLYQKGMLTLEDGGYLTDLGHETAEHAQALLTLLAPPQIA
ncbi:MAG: TIGR02647 family protein [Gammaproteobacteria bacterium]|nr:TIGR02647 family protein [Gammaproteobacteria bacterium]